MSGGNVKPLPMEEGGVFRLAPSIVGNGPTEPLDMLGAMSQVEWLAEVQLAGAGSACPSTGPEP